MILEHVTIANDLVSEKSKFFMGGGISKDASYVTIRVLKYSLNSEILVLGGLKIKIF